VEDTVEIVDVYWSFRSPYSYLATPEMLEIPKKYDVQLNLRVVMPIAIRAPELLFNPANANRTRYILVDAFRRAEFLGLAMSWPSPDPVVQDFSTMEIASDQPHIHRLSRLGVEAQRQGQGIQFAAEVAKLIWTGTENWHQGDLLAEAAARASLDLDTMEQAIASGDHAAEIDANQAQLDTLGGWGVPTFVVKDEIFFGQDRIDTLCWRLDQLK
jgi:2-hydroxychromene-2-carboxylate isomerase